MDDAQRAELVADVQELAQRAVGRLDGLTDDDRDAFVDRIAGATRQVVDAIARELHDRRDAARLLDLRGELTHAVGSLQPGADAVGPVVGVLRRHAGLTRGELAQAIGCGTTTVDRWEAGQPTRCHAGHMVAAANLLGVSPVALYTTVATVAGWTA